MYLCVNYCVNPCVNIWKGESTIVNAEFNIKVITSKDKVAWDIRRIHPCGDYEKCGRLSVYVFDGEDEFREILHSLPEDIIDMINMSIETEERDVIP